MIKIFKNQPIATFDIEGNIVRENADLVKLSDVVAELELIRKESRYFTEYEAIEKAISRLTGKGE